LEIFRPLDSAPGALGQNLALSGMLPGYKGGIKSLNLNVLGFNTYNTVPDKHLSKVAKNL